MYRVSQYISMLNKYNFNRETRLLLAVGEKMKNEDLGGGDETVNFTLNLNSKEKVIIFYHVMGLNIVRALPKFKK